MVMHQIGTKTLLTLLLYLEITQRGGSTLRLKTNKDYGSLDRSFPPNDSSLKLIKKLINEKNL